MSRALLVWAALAAVLFAFAAARLERTDALARLLPSDGALAQAAAAALDGRTADVVLIEVDGTGADRDALRAAVAAVEASALASGRFARVRGHVDPLGDGRAVRDVAVRHAVALLPEDELRQRTSPDGVRRALLGWQARLFGPAGAIAVRGMTEDPLDLGGAALERLRAHGGPWRVQPEGGLLLDASGQRALVLATPARGALEGAEDAGLAEAMGPILAASPLPARWFGGPRVATDMAAAIQRDVSVGSTLSVLALVVVVAVGFRSVRPLVGLALPVASTIACVAAALAARSPIHGISLGFGGALLGIAVDYWIHLYVAASARGGSGPDDREAAAQDAWREIRGSLGLSAATTVLAFSVLLGSRFPVIRDLGASGVAAIVGATVGTWLVGPVVFRWTGGVSQPPIVWRPPLPLVWGVVAAVGLLGLLATRVTFDGDPRRLIAVSDETRALEAELAERYGGIGTGGMIVVPGGGPDALDRAAAAAAVFGAVPGVTVSSPTVLVPGPALEAQRRAAMPPPEVLRQRLVDAAAAVGIEPASLLPAIDRLYEEAPVTAATWADTPLAEVVDRAIGPDAVTLEVVLADPALAASVVLPPGATLVVPTALAAQGTAEIRDELVRLGGLSALGVAGLLIVRYRRPRLVLAAAAPVIAAACATLGALAAVGWPLDAVGTSVLVLILGLTVDYGIFLVDAPHGARGVALAAATSIAGFGPLALSRSPGLASAGLVVAVGLGAAALTAIVVTPRIADGSLVPRRAGWLRGSVVGGVLALNVQLLVLVRFVAVPPEVTVPDGEVTGSADDRRLVGSGERPHRLVRKDGVWTMAVSGSHAEMGAAHGRLTHDLRERLEAETFAAFQRAVPNPLARAAILEGVLVAGAGLDAHVDDRWRRELAGMVRATPDPRAWLLPAYTRKLYFHALHDIGQALVDSPLVACTGLLATGAATAEGHTLLARSFDFEGGDTFDTDKVVIVRRPDDGLATVSVAFPGMIGVVSGVNERRIAVALQAAGSEVRPRMAEPMTFVLREVLEQASSLDDVQRILDARRGFGTEIVLAADGARGETAVFEITPDRVERLPGGELLGVSNHFRTEALAGDAENQRRIEQQTTAVRLRRIDERLVAARGALDLPEAASILRDRAGPGGAPLPRGHRWALDADIASHTVAFDVTSGELWVSVAPNLSGGFVRYQLDDLLAGRLEPSVALGPTDVASALRTHRGRALLREAKHARDPEPLLREALRHLPDHPEALLRLAEVVDDDDEVRALLHRAAAGPPEDARDRARLDALRAEVGP